MIYYIIISRENQKGNKPPLQTRSPSVSPEIDSLPPARERPSRRICSEGNPPACVRSSPNPCINAG